MLFDCKILKIHNLQFHWYGERSGDNDEAFQWGRDLINLFFSKDVYKRSLFFSLALADVFEKNEKKNKTTSVYRLGQK